MRATLRWIGQEAKEEVTIIAKKILKASQHTHERGLGKFSIPYSNYIYDIVIGQFVVAQW